MSANMSASVPLGGGYACSSCGQWVPPNTMHHCGGGTRWVNPPPVPDPALDRIATALERLCEILDRRKDRT